jgi:hypothetical protein
MEVLTGILWKICVSLTWTLSVRKKQQLQLGQLSKEQASQHFWLLCCFLFGSWCPVVANFSKIMGGVTYGDVWWKIKIVDTYVRYVALDLWPNRSYLMGWKVWQTPDSADFTYRFFENWFYLWSKISIVDVTIKVGLYKLLNILYSNLC